MAAEFGALLWRLGASTYACAGPDRIVCAYSTAGLGQLAVLELKSKALQPIETPFTEFGSIRADGRTLPLGGLTLTGIRKSHTIPAAMSGTGKDIVIIDEYWYSPDLSVYMIIKHNDPRTGEQIVAVTDVDRHEPNASVFTIPASYKIVDETPAAP